MQDYGLPRRKVLKMAAMMAGATIAAQASGATSIAKGNGCSCGRIDVHSHFLPDVYQRALRDAGLTHIDGGIPIARWSAPDLLAMMDAAGIATSMLSISSPGLHFLPPIQGVRLAREVNEAGAELVRTHPDRFGQFAVLPVLDVPASLAEIAYAYDVLKVDGIGLETNSKGVYLGDPHFTPIFDELERRKAVVFLHPTSPECLAQVGMGFPGPLIEFPFDTTRSVVSLIFAGVFRTRPNIRMILPHGGGALPLLLSRIAAISSTPFVTPRPEGGAAEVIEEVRRMFFDLAVSATPLNFHALLEVTDVSHILFGTDYPFSPPPLLAANNAGFGKLMDSLTADQRAMVEYGNATALFPRLKSYLDTKR